jgi:hypothetical protein
MLLIRRLRERRNCAVMHVFYVATQLKGDVIGMCDAATFQSGQGHGA